VTKAKIHPTKQALIEAAVALLDEDPSEHFSVDTVLERSGISRGSLYHHFDDYNDVIEQAKVFQFSRFVDASAERFAEILKDIEYPDQLKVALHGVTKITQAPASKNVRVTRARIIGEASSVPRFAAKLQIEIDRLTNAIETSVQGAIDSGLFNKRFTARTIAVFIQAYTLGKVLDDLASVKVSEEDWNSLIDAIIAEVFIAS